MSSKQEQINDSDYDPDYFNPFGPLAEEEVDDTPDKDKKA